MKIELLSCSVIYFGNFCKFCKVLCCNPPPPHRAAQQPPQRAAVSASRATVEQSSESKGSASIRRYLMIMVAASRGVKPHTATTERNLRINACNRLHCGATPPPIATAKGQTRRPGARNRCVGDPAKEKMHPSGWDRSREYSRRPQGMYELRM